MLVINPRIQIPLREFEFSFCRSSGPGGQNVNKVSSKATLRWRVRQSRSLPEPVRERLVARFSRRITAQGELVVSSQRFRDAGRNAADCLEKLRKMVSETAQAPRRRKPTTPTRASKMRRLAAKRTHSRKKEQRQRLGEE